MSFLAPERFLLIIPVLALAAGYLVLQRRRRRYAVRFTNLDLLDEVAPQRPGWRRHVAAGLAGLAAVAMVVGLAQPVAAVEVPTEDTLVMLALDTSMSMAATDVSPSRMEAAVDEASDFVESLPDGVDVGLVTFDGTAQVLAAPTDDHDAVVAAIAGVTTGRGTAGGDAIEAALAAIDVVLDRMEAVGATALSDSSPTDDAAEETAEETAEEPAATIVMLSDGASTAGVGILTAAEGAAEQGVPVSTITYGSADGVVSVDGQSVGVPPDAATMAEVADVTGGTAFAAASADDLASVYADLEARIDTVTEERDISPIFVGVGLAALLAAAGAAFVWTGRFL